jgi:hypothetical protein
MAVTDVTCVGLHTGPAPPARQPLPLAAEKPVQPISTPLQPLAAAKVRLFQSPPPLPPPPLVSVLFG